jgi:hypothetical protein
MFYFYQPLSKTSILLISHGRVKIKVFYNQSKKSKNNKIIFFIYRLQIFIKLFIEDKTTKLYISIVLDYLLKYKQYYFHTG